MRVLCVSGSRAKLPDPVYPLGAAIVATAAEHAGHEVFCFDAIRHKDPSSVLGSVVDTSRPEIILMSIRNIDSAAFPMPERYFEDHKPLVELLRKKTSAPIVLGGSGFSLMPELFMDYLKADIGIVGDGEITTLEVLNALEEGKKTEPIVFSPPVSAPFLSADRDKFDADWYYQNGGVANIQTKRGCPLKCIYCTYPNLEGDVFRKSEPGAVIDEIQSLSSRGVKHFFFVDTAFNASESHAIEVCEEIIRRDLNISFAAYLIPKIRNSEFPRLLKRAGCTAAEFGTDALSDEMLVSYKKGFSVSDVLNFSDSMKTLEIPQCHNLILGGPGETKETMETSIQRMDRIDPTAMILTIGLRVFPNTELAALAASLGTKIDGNQLEPTFYIEEAVADDIVEKCAAWVDARRGWICPGLAKRYNLRYLERLRLHRGRKGPLWTIF